MSDITNADRAAWAATAIDAFTSECRMDGEDNQTKAKDLATNLVHYLRLECGLSLEEAGNVIHNAVSMAEEEADEDSDGDDGPVLRTYGVRLFATFRGECDTEVEATSFEEAVAKAKLLTHDAYNYSIDDTIEGDETMMVYGPDENDPNDDDKWGGDGVEIDKRKDGEPFSWDTCQLTKDLAALADIKNETYVREQTALLIARAKGFCSKGE